MSGKNVPLSKNFFKDRWKNPVKRLGKKIIPILLAMVTVFIIFVSSFIGIPYLIYSTPIYVLASFKVFVAVILGTAAVILRHYLLLRQRARFSPIRIRVRDQR